jgi:hypothetical protein
LVLCRDVYHCTPQELEEIPPETILAHLALLDVEGNYLKEKHGKK